VAAWRWRRRTDVRIAESLARARAFLRDVIDTSPNPIIVRRSAGAPLVLNRAALHVPGLGGIALAPSGDAVEDAACARLRALEETVAATGEEGRIDELPLRDADGSERWFRVVMRRGDAPGDLPARHVIITAVDVTGFKRAEVALTESRDGLRRSREEARALSRQLLSAQEDERRRLAADMHDDVTQRLAGLAMLSWSALASLERPSAGSDALRQVRSVATDLELLARQVQSMARELHPPALDTFGLVDALHAEVSNFTERTGLPVTLEATQDALDVPADVALALYRIVQEALRNAHTHASATCASVHVAREADALVIEVRDDGTGFDLQAPRGRAGIGLSTMRERARLAGAELRIDTRPGGGTCVRVRWPSSLADDTPGR
jgi:signal transduction histidine kinase